MPIGCALEYTLSPKSLLWGWYMWFLSAGGWSGVVFLQVRLSCAAHASRLQSLEQCLCTRPPHCPLNHSAGPVVSAHGPWSKGVGTAISHQGVFSEVPGWRPLHEASCEQVKLNPAPDSFCQARQPGSCRHVAFFFQLQGRLTSAPRAGPSGWGSGGGALRPACPSREGLEVQGVL